MANETKGIAMRWFGILAAVILTAVVLNDAFEVVLLPRRVRHGFRLARVFYRTSWMFGRSVANLLPRGHWQTSLLSAFGPLSLFVLVMLWAAGLIVGFALFHWSLGTPLSVTRAGLDDYLYFSGTTFFTLGYGDMVPTGAIGRTLSVAESGVGFVFLAVIVSYLPVLYQAFSRREITIALLDARAGSPPSAGEMLRRLAAGHSPSGVGPFLIEWERWAAELLESHISFPVLSYYRSQHENQSWVGALTAILDTSALLLAGVQGPDGYQARLTFAMARHAAVDLALVFQTPPRQPQPNRLTEADFARLRDSLRGAGLIIRDGPAAPAALAELRALYEPFVNALADYFVLALPSFQPEKTPIDNWQTSPWTPRSPSLGNLTAVRVAEDHFG
jgi:hypothetical protein